MKSIGSSLRQVIDAELVARARHRALTSLLGFPPRAIPAGPSGYQGERAAAYEADRARRTMFHWEQRIIGELLLQVPRGSARVLDVPVGTGRFIPIYAELGLETVGLDASRDMLAAAAAARDAGQHPVTLVKGSATALPFPDDSFDVLVCFRFLPGKLSLRRARQALKEFARVTRGELHLLLKVGEREFPPSWRDEYARLGTRPEHELRAILGGAGLSIDRIERADLGPKAVFTCRRTTTPTVSA
jgi:SAM-dependent methyltransferase